MTFVSELDPQILWRHFDRILTIPRGSGNEGGMRAFVREVGEKRGLEVRGDATGNLVIAIPASPGREQAPVVVLQAHLDMVNEKNRDTQHDFDRDPIQPVRAGEFLRANGTTLGSDNGIGVASMLALTEESGLAHGPLELLFTIDEERGLTGAKNFDPALIRGRMLINLDSEEEGVLTVGCAGGADSRLRLPLEMTSVAPGSGALEITVLGLKGGHSGVDIHLQRGNAIKILARSLHAASRETPLRLAALAGGDKTNAIPREVRATLVAPASELAKVEARLEHELRAVAAEIAVADPGLSWTFAAVPCPSAAWSEESSRRALQLLEALPHGVQVMSYDLPDLVETSTNLASVAVQGAELAIALSNRSSVASALLALRQKVRAAAGLAGASVAEGDGYPGWKPDLSSHLLEVMKRTHEQVLGFAPKVGAIHAGLECGLIGERIPGMDMISFGPTIQFPHSPDERVEIATVPRFYHLLKATLTELAG
ncbi:MAG: aminoacyl-histidine dipeptidase [Thermoanaerobaculia bacterium]